MGAATRILVATMLVLAACGGDDGPFLAGDALQESGGDAVASPDMEEPTGEVPTEGLPADGAGDADETPGDLPGDAVLDEGVGPEPVDPALAAILQHILQDYVRFSGDPGIAFAVLDGDRRAWSGTAGLADVKEGTPVGPDSRFRVGSNTKPFTATWILQLVEEGKVVLDAPLTDYLPEYGMWADVTIRHLLGMQSGIPEYIVDPALLLQLLADPEHVWTPAEILTFMKDRPLQYPPGTSGSYSNTNWILLGLVGEKVTGRSARDEIHDRLLAPLGLTRTYLEQAGDDTAELVHGYMDLSVLVPLLKMPSAMFAAIPESLYLPGTQTIDATTLMPPSVTWTAGGIVSTPSDLATFQRALQRGLLLGPAMMAEMRDWHPITLMGGQVDYGLGLMRQPTVLGDLYGHGGLNFGFHVETYYSPDLDLAFCHMHNFLPAQTVAVTTEVLTAFLTGGMDPLPDCEIPEDFWGDTPVDRPVMKALFKGPVGDATKPQAQQPGMSSTWATLGAAWVRLFGFDRVGIYAGASRSSSAMGTRVTMTSWGRGDGGDNSLREMFWSLDPDLVTRADGNGVVALSAADAYSAGAMLVDYGMDENLRATRACIVAVADLSQGARLFSCEGAATDLSVGRTIRLAGRLPLVTDPAVLDAIVANLGMQRCTCFDAAQQPVPCP